MRQETCGTIIEYEDVTATEATKADGGALGMRSVTFDELDAHEESPDLIGSEAVDWQGRGNVLSKRAGTAAWPRSGTSMCSILEAST